MDLFFQACNLYPRLFISLVYTSRSGYWLTATPEILLEGEGSSWRTIALAGTMQLKGDQLGGEGETLSWTTKNIQEQRFVTTYITECLEQFTSDFREEGPYTVRAANLVHLRSDFTFTLPDTQHIGDLLQTLHPTPAVCGLPKRDAFRFIVGNEHTPRRYYSGFMGPLLILKFALAALTAYLYIRRFTKTPEAASLGGILYAFSGFSVYNIFFNHFHEAIIVFPLLLLALELLITENRRGAFAVTVALAAAVNYFFFFGMVVFTLIYFFVRVFSGTVRLKFTVFLALVFEAVIGFCASAVIVLPSVLAIIGNDRVSDFLLGWSAIVYGKESIYPNILECFFFPPDLPARPVFFPEANVKWSSLGGWLPLFSMTGVFAFFKTRKNHWLRRMIGICIFMAMVPVLNSAFYAFNTSYYARWFYMPILLMCLMTADMCEDESSDMRYGISWTLGITLAAALTIGFFPQKKDEKLIFGLFTKPQDLTYILRYAATCAIAVLSLVLLAVLLRLRRKSAGRFIRVATVCTLIVSVLYANVFVATGRSHSYEIKDVMIDHLIEGEVKLPDTGDYRIDVYDGVDNTAMYLGYPSINAFHSVVPASVAQFYDYIDVERSVASRPDEGYPALRSLLSVKYLLNDRTLEKFTDENGETKMPGFKYLKTDGGYHVFENKNYVGYGFSYDYYMTEDDCEDYSGEMRSRLMLKAVLLSKSQVKKYRGILKNVSHREYTGFDDAGARRRGA